MWITRGEYLGFPKVECLQSWIMKTEILGDYLREQEVSALMLTSSHTKKDKRGKGQGSVSKEIGQCQVDLSLLESEIFPIGVNLLLWKRTKYPLSLWEFLSFPKGPQIWENFFPLLSTCTYDVSEILLNLLSQGISQLSLIIRHIFIHGLWGLISTSGPQSTALKIGFWLLFPGKMTNPSQGIGCLKEHKLQ